MATPQARSRTALVLRYLDNLMPATVAAGNAAAPAVDAGSLLSALGVALAVLGAAARLSPRAALPAATLLSLGLAAALPPASSSVARARLDAAAKALSELLLYLFFAGAGAAGGAAGSVLVDAGPRLLAFLGVLYAGHAAIVSFRRADIPRTGRGDAAAATLTFRDTAGTR